MSQKFSRFETEFILPPDEIDMTNHPCDSCAGDETR